MFGRRRSEVEHQWTGDDVLVDRTTPNKYGGGAV